MITIPDDKSDIVAITLQKLSARSIKLHRARRENPSDLTYYMVTGMKIS